MFPKKMHHHCFCFCFLKKMFYRLFVLTFVIPLRSSMNGGSIHELRTFPFRTKIFLILKNRHDEYSCDKFNVAQRTLTRWFVRTNITLCVRFINVDFLNRKVDVILWLVRWVDPWIIDMFSSNGAVSRIMIIS